MSVEADLYVQRLRDDHKAIAQVLRGLDKDIRKLLGSGLHNFEATTLRSINSALQYLQGYPEIWHHPFEDRAFQRLADRKTGCGRLLETLLKEHESLSYRTADLQRRFGVCLELSEPANASLIKDCYDYINAQFNHHHRENTQIFPLLEQNLNIDDWLSIELSLTEAPRDPSLYRHYNALFNRLVETG